MSKKIERNRKIRKQYEYMDHNVRHDMRDDDWVREREKDGEKLKVTNQTVLYVTVRTKLDEITGFEFLG